MLFHQSITNVDFNSNNSLLQIVLTETMIYNNALWQDSPLIMNITDMENTSKDKFLSSYVNNCILISLDLVPDAAKKTQDCKTFLIYELKTDCIDEHIRLTDCKNGEITRLLQSGMFNLKH